MQKQHSRRRPHGSSLALRLALASGLLLLAVGSVNCAGGDKYRVVCVEQNIETLEEIASGKLDRYNPHVAAWERQVAQLCGWVAEEDFRDANN